VVLNPFTRKRLTLQQVIFSSINSTPWDFLLVYFFSLTKEGEFLNKKTKNL